MLDRLISSAVAVLDNLIKMVDEPLTLSPQPLPQPCFFSKILLALSRVVWCSLYFHGCFLLVFLLLYTCMSHQYSDVSSSPVLARRDPSSFPN